MANPVNPGTFENWISDRQPFSTVAPKAGSTGDFDIWLTDRQQFQDYVEVAAVTGVPKHFMHYQRMRRR